MASTGCLTMETTMADTKAVWLDVNVSDISPDAKAQYEAYKAAYRVMKEARAQFEETMAMDYAVATGKRLVFGYNFGKLSIAVVADDKPRKVAKAKVSLAEFLKQQAQR